MAMRKKVPGRFGFTLLEMILAIAILGTTLAILAQIADTGVDAAREARAMANARMVCQSKLNELLLNIDAGQSPTAIVDAPAESFDSSTTDSFIYSVEITPGQMDGLMAARVTVTAFGGDGSEKLAVFALDRWFIDPTMGLVEAEAEELAAREEIANGTSAEGTL